MSEEKMRAKFEAWQVSGGFKRPNDPGEWEAWQAAWQAALQESEAGAFGTVVTFEDGSNVFRNTGEPFPPTAKGYIATEVYTAPQYAQAIETAAIMKCVEVIDEKSEAGYTADWFTAKTALLALIPQDGGTQLEEFGMRVASKAAGYGWSMGMEGADTMGTDLRSIVTNLIGAAK